MGVTVTEGAAQRYASARKVVTHPAGRSVPSGKVRAPMSRTPHVAQAEKVKASSVLLLSFMAALVTMGFIGLANLQAQESAAIPGNLGVVQVQEGETLSDLAARVAPDAPQSGVIAQIRELNSLSTSALNTGQTLISPIG
ncbi:MAG: LysM peptidoglycan-binding domain-containing protein [Mycobacteriaceae bacterium]